MVFREKDLIVSCASSLVYRLDPVSGRNHEGGETRYEEPLSPSAAYSAHADEDPTATPYRFRYSSALGRIMTWSFVKVGMVGLLYHKNFSCLLLPASSFPWEDANWLVHAPMFRTVY